VLRQLFFVVLCTLAAPAFAEVFSGRVVSIADGDTLTVLRGRKQVKIRLAEIDAPERKQPFGTRARAALAELCFGRTAEVTALSKDRYGRTLARVECDGRDAGGLQVRDGMAWVYRQYAARESILFAVEMDAKLARRGLWADPAPVPPWEWRKQKRKPVAG